jgi:hypothetical protein
MFWLRVYRLIRESSAPSNKEILYETLSPDGAWTPKLSHWGTKNKVEQKQQKKKEKQTIMKQWMNALQDGSTQEHS